MGKDFFVITEEMIHSVWNENVLETKRSLLLEICNNLVGRYDRIAKLKASITECMSIQKLNVIATNMYLVNKDSCSMTKASQTFKQNRKDFFDKQKHVRTQK